MFFFSNKCFSFLKVLPIAFAKCATATVSCEYVHSTFFIKAHTTRFRLQLFYCMSIFINCGLKKQFFLIYSYKNHYLEYQNNFHLLNLKPIFFFGEEEVWKKLNLLIVCLKKLDLFKFE